MWGVFECLGCSASKQDAVELFEVTSFGSPSTEGLYWSQDALCLHQVGGTHTIEAFGWWIIRRLRSR
jgi:hypothetical protein